MGDSNLNKYGDLSREQAGFLKAKLLDRGQHLMVTERFGQVDPHQKNKTKTINWRRYHSLPRATAPLAEGIPPQGRKLTFTDITLTLEQYGDAVQYSDVVLDTHIDAISDVASNACSEQIAETVEEIRINTLKAGSNVFYANSAAGRSTVNSPPTRGDFRRIYRYFKKYKGREISEIIKASAKISTEAVDPAYFVMGHTDLDSDIRGISGFIPWKDYSNSDKRLPGEIGAIEQFRIILTAMFDPWTTAGLTGTTYLSGGVAVSSTAQCDVYPLICVARDAYGIVALQGQNVVTPAVVSPKPQVGDMLGQIGFVSWKTMQGCIILNHNWLARLECAATANPS